MKITVVGNGNVGTHLQVALRNAGHEIAQVYSRTRRAEGETLREGSDIYIICVTDTALPEVAAEVCSMAGNALVVHTAGSIGLETLHARNCGVMYPMQTFSRNKAVDFRRVPLFIEANNEEAMKMLESLAQSLSDTVRPLGSEERRQLHVAAVFACNFANHCVALADRQLQQIGLDWRILLPLIDETVEKLHHLSPTQAQTGPAARGDKTVMERHMEMIDDDNVRDIYRRLSESISIMQRMTANVPAERQ